MEPVVVLNSRRSIFLFAGAYALIIAVGLWVNEFAVFDLLYLLLFLALAIPVAVWQWLDRRPQIVLDDWGVRGRRLRREGVAWTQLRGASIKPLGGMDHLWLELREDRQGPGPSPRVIPVRANHLELSSDRLLVLVQQRLATRGPGHDVAR